MLKPKLTKMLKVNGGGKGLRGLQEGGEPASVNASEFHIQAFLIGPQNVRSVEINKLMVVNFNCRHIFIV